MQFLVLMQHMIVKVGKKELDNKKIYFIKVFHITVIKI